MSGVAITPQNRVHHRLQATIDREKGVMGRSVAADFGDMGPDRLWKLDIFKVDGARFGERAVAITKERRDAWA